MDALLIGLWLLCLLLPLTIRCRARPAIVIVVLPVVLADQGAAPLDGEAWLKRQLEVLEKEGKT